MMEMLKLRQNKKKLFSCAGTLCQSQLFILFVQYCERLKNEMELPLRLRRQKSFVKIKGKQKKTIFCNNVEKLSIARSTYT